MVPVLLSAASAPAHFAKIAKKIYPIAAVLSVTEKFAVPAFRPTNVLRAKYSGVSVVKKEEMLNNTVSMVPEGFSLKSRVNAAQAVSDATTTIVIIPQNLKIVVKTV